MPNNETSKMWEYIGLNIYNFFLSLLHARMSNISLLCKKLFPLPFFIEVCPMMWSNFLLLASSPEMISFQFLRMRFFVLMQCYVFLPRWSPSVNRKSPSCKHTETFHFRPTAEVPIPDHET